jgi:tetraacyldisaccharide 4'-kinase
LNQETFHKLISGQTRGFGAALLRFCLEVAAKFYSAIIALRNLAYSKGWLKVHTAGAAVISVGNITVGGTGKTPLVIWLCNTITQNSKLKIQNCGISILTRGYKTYTKGRGTSDERRATRIDEPAILAESCPQAKVIVNPDRVAAARQAVEKFGVNVLIMDDGFQHRRLARDLDIVTIDATCPFGCGKMLPAGLLREPADSLKRADAIVITRCNQVGENELAELEKKLRLLNPDTMIARSIHTPAYAKSVDGRKISPDGLKGKKIFAFCGIANPAAFFNTINEIGCNVIGSKIYDDHYQYADNDLSDICEQAGHFKADLILTTQKDWSRLPLENWNLSAVRVAESKIDIGFAYLAIELKFISGENKITQLIENALAGKITWSQNV